MHTEFAPAKINLYLHVTGKRADGYHLLESLVAFADVGDSLQVAATGDEISLRIEGEFAGVLGDVKENLVWRAAQEVRQAFGVTRGAAITLTKQLPVAAGIGGGSADAAAALRALRVVWDLPEDGRWHAIAARLGADVPVCFASRSSLIKGVGEKVEAVAVPLCHALLLNPGLPLMTRDVFAAYVSSPAAVGKNDVEWLQGTRNDLEPAALSLLPVVGDMLMLLARQQGCALARMSGSGATCFGLFGHKEEAAKAAEVIQALHPTWWVRPATIGDDNGR